MIEKYIIKYNKVVLIGLITSQTNKNNCINNLNELTSLTHTLNGIVYKQFIQKIYTKNPKTLIGKGKIQEIYDYVILHNIDTIIFDYSLTPTQLKNIQTIIHRVSIIDRTQVILDIFSKRAKTFYAKTQVKLAQYKYMLPRLKGLWTHLERQKGGIGIRSGSGEAEIETDKRIITTRIKNLKKKILKINQQLLIQRQNRKMFTNVSLIGYTNAGKSTIMNQLAKTNLLTENKLFATVDTTTRKIFIQNKYILISDTVGFISNLPTQLLESFQSTIYEIKYSNMILHIVDASDVYFIKKIINVNKILQMLNIENKNFIIILNKIDICLKKNKILEIFEYHLKNKLLHDNNNIITYTCVSAYQKNDIIYIKKILNKYVS